MKCQTNQFNCPVEATLSLIGGKYKPLILWHLIDHPLHYMKDKNKQEFHGTRDEVVAKGYSPCGRCKP